MKEAEADAKIKSTMINLEVDTELLEKVREKGVECPPRMLGYYPFCPLASPEMVCTW